MPETVTYDKKQKIIMVKSWGLVTEAMMVETRDKVEWLHLEYGCNRVLLDVREQKNIPGERFITMFAKAIDYTFPNTLRMGLVVSDPPNEKILLLVKTINEAEMPIATFHTLEECIAWLMQ